MHQITLLLTKSAVVQSNYVSAHPTERQGPFPKFLNALLCQFRPNQIIFYKERLIWVAALFECLH